LSFAPCDARSRPARWSRSWVSNKPVKKTWVVCTKRLCQNGLGAKINVNTFRKKLGVDTNLRGRKKTWVVCTKKVGGQNGLGVTGAE